jgi:hypothetical protein
MALQLPQTVEMYAGEDLDIPLALDPPADVSGWTVTFTLADSPGGTVRVRKTVGAGIAWSDVAHGIGAVTLLHADTVGLPAGTYSWDVQRTNAGGSREYASGILILRPTAGDWT